MATIKEVAKKARVSVGTVSNVLTGAVPVSPRLKDRVLEVIKQLDYHPNYVARSLKKRRTNTIGMVVSDITNPIIPQLVRGAEDQAWAAQFMLITFNSDNQIEREQQMLGALRSRQVDGILLVAANGADHSHVKLLHDSGLPLVCLARQIQGLDVDCVVADHAAGAYEAVKHLNSLGHRTIALVNGDLELQTSLDRHAGYRRALEEAGIPYREELVILGGYRAEDSYAGGSQLMRQNPRPTAVLTANSILALGFLRALRESGLTCPGQIALASFDDAIFAEALRPSLTSIALPNYQLGAQAMDLLLKRIEDPARERTRLLLPPKLIIRESSGSTHAAA
jgi:LacI family transcriptional regulator